MKTLDLFNSQYERNLHEGATDSCDAGAEMRAQMTSLVERARRCSGMEERACLMREYAELKEAMGRAGTDVMTAQDRVKSANPAPQGADVITAKQRMAPHKPSFSRGVGRGMRAAWDAITLEDESDQEQQAMELLQAAIEHGDWDPAVWIAHEFPGTLVDKLVTRVLLKNRRETNPNALLHDLEELLNAQQLGEAQKKSSEDLGAIKDPAVQQAIKLARARYPSADSDVEAFIKDTETHLDQDEADIDQEQDLNTKQEAMLQHIMDLDKKQSSDIDDIKDRLASVNKRLNNVLGQIQSNPVDEAGTMTPGHRPGWALDPKTKLELKRRREQQKTIAKWAGKDVPKQDREQGVAEGWSGNEPTWVCVNGKRWKKFPTEDHARNVGEKLQAKFRKEGRKDVVSYDHDLEDLEEVSKQTLGSYVKKAGQDIVQRATGSSYQSGAAGDKYNKAEPSAKELRRERGIERAVSKLTK